MIRGISRPRVTAELDGVEVSDLKPPGCTSYRVVTLVAALPGQALEVAGGKQI
jgi:hypothetical protein